MPKPRPAPMPDVVVHVTPRLVSHDCSTWALMVLTGRSYTEVRGAVEKEDSKAGEEGLWWSQVRRAARRLGVTLRTKRHAVLDEDTGILSVTFSDKTPHAVVLLQGPVIVDADNTVWQADAYIAAKSVKVGSVLVVAPKKAT